MVQPTRRTVLQALGTLAVGGLGGCQFAQSSPSSDPDGSGSPGATAPTATDPCPAGQPPTPPEFVDDPPAYPERPERLTAETVQSFAERYERAYSYNQEIVEADRPERVSVSVDTTEYSQTDRGFEVTVGGYVNFDEYHPEPLVTDGPAASTPTPIGSSHLVVEATYVVTDRVVERDGVVVECW